MPQETLSLIAGGAISLCSICLSSIVTLLTLVITNYFQRKNDERKRQWELEDKESERRLESKEKMIERIQSYLNTYLEASSILTNYELALIHSQDAKTHYPDYVKAREMTHFSPEMLSRLILLNDSDFLSLNTQLTSLFHKEYQAAGKIAQKLLNAESIDKDFESKRITAFNNKFGEIIGAMQRIINQKI